jgi:hypothetical protein
MLMLIMLMVGSPNDLKRVANFKFNFSNDQRYSPRTNYCSFKVCMQLYVHTQALWLCLLPKLPATLC